MEASTVPSQRLNLLDILNSDVGEHIFAFVQKNGDIREARAGCRVLRDFVDGNITSVHVTASFADRDRWQDAAVPLPLHRWTRCSHIDLDLELLEPPLDFSPYLNTLVGEALENFNEFIREPLEDLRHVGPVRAELGAHLMALLFFGNALEERMRITSLAVRCRNQLQVPVPGAAIAALLQRLPGLQRVTLHSNLPNSTPEQQAIFGAVAGLPALQELALPACSALEGIGALADSSVRRLTIRVDRDSLSSGPRAPELLTSQAFLPALGRLHQLQELCIDPAAKLSPQQLRTLLEGLPPSVTTVRLPRCSLLQRPLPPVPSHVARGPPNELLAHLRPWRAPGELPDVVLRRDGGTITGLMLQPADSIVALERLVHFAEAVLRPLGVSGHQRLRDISLPRINVRSQDEAATAPTAFQYLEHLLQTCPRVEVEAVLADQLVAPAAVARAVWLLGGPRNVKELQLMMHDREFGTVRVHLQEQAVASQVAPPARAAGAGCEHGAAAPQAADAAAPSLVDLALARLMAGGTTAAAGAAATGTTAAPAGSLPTDSQLQERSGPEGLRAGRLPLLLLQGPMLGGLPSADLGAVHAWLQPLARRAITLFREQAGAADGRNLLRPRWSFLSLLGCTAAAPAILLQCNMAAAQPFMAAAAMEAAVAAGAADEMGEAVAAAAAAAEGAAQEAVPAPLPLQALLADVQVSAKPQWWSAMMEPFISAMRQAAQGVWDGEGFAADWSERQRLDWVAKQLVPLCELPGACLAASRGMPTAAVLDPLPNAGQA